jgi:uncharacterized protein YukE
MGTAENKLKAERVRREAQQLEDHPSVEKLAEIVAALAKVVEDVAKSVELLDVEVASITRDRRGIR